MARSHESDDVGTSRVVVRQSVPKATSSGGGPESVTDSLQTGMFLKQLELKIVTNNGARLHRTITSYKQLLGHC